MSDIATNTSAGMPSAGRLAHKTGKLLIDGFAILLLVPVTLAVACVIVLLNPFLNPGPLLFAQDRMGQRGRRFTAYKFRTMTGESAPRGPFDPVEAARITPFGRIMRRTRIDELPQLINVFLGDMTLIGPRPDMYDHALAYLADVPGYRSRLAVRPGMTGLAQISVGYADDSETVRRKVDADLTYLREGSVRVDLWIVWRTVACVLRLQGS